MKTPLTIAHLHCTPAYGGPDSTTFSLFKYLDRNRFRQYLIFLSHPRMLNNLLVEKASALGIGVFNLFARGKFNPGVLKQTVSLVRKNRIQILHGHGYKSDIIAYLAARLTPVKLVSTLHGWVERSFRTRLYKQIDMYVLRRFDHLIAVSRVQEEEVLRRGYSQDAVSLIPNSVDLQEYSITGRDPLAREKKLNINRTVPLIGMVGRLNLEKNPELLLTAIPALKKEFPRLKCLFIGDGPLKDDLRKKAVQLGISDSALFLGYRSDVRDLLPLLDVVINPSLREGVPNAVLEGMALERAVVATKVGGVGDVITDDRDGLLIASGDRAALVHALADLLRKPDLRRKLGEQARRTVEDRFSDERMVAQVAEVYERFSGD